ncbi:Uncharacterised protein [Vibrio cholerae]|nr:Uncharacterised protein [Vibrio cholerae]
MISATIGASISSEALTNKVFTVFSIGRPCCSTNSAMVFALGVSTKVIACVGAGRSIAGATASAFSMLAA